jgi:serine/threonine protein phosphatase PrpC
VDLFYLTESMVSRALGDGDLSYKDKTKRPEYELVSCLPDIEIFDRGDKDESLILACDGVWDVMKNQQVADLFAHEYHNKTHDIGYICENIIQACYNTGSKDNITFLGVAFNNI